MIWRLSLKFNLRAAMASFSALKNEVFTREQKRQQYGDKILGLNAFERHKRFMNDYQQYYGAGGGSHEQVYPVKTDQDTLRETYRFIRTEEDDLERSWEQRLAKRYHDKLFKEYCIADMSRYRENRIGLRWRSEKEVVSGKGQFECGNKKCSNREGLRSYEVNFAYTEAGEGKQALVKLRVCPKCTYKLNYRKEKELEKRLRKESRRRRRKLMKEKTRERRKKSKDKKREDTRNKSQASSESEEEDSDGSDSSEHLEEAPRFKRSDGEGGNKNQLLHEIENKEGDFEPFFHGMFL